MFETAMITTMHGLMSYRFPTAVREILKGLLRYRNAGLNHTI